MKFTLKDYQEDAVRDVLESLKKAKKRWVEDQDKHSFSLTATTGAGKTVMAAAVFEALFHGDDNFDFEPDPSAVVIWFSDDPSLNEQSRFRLLEASDRLSLSDMVVVQNTFQRESFEAGKIYFLNTQKLSKGSLLVRGFDPDDDDIEKDDRQGNILPDLRSHTIWDTIKNTIDDPNLTLYLVLDEAHRGMKENRKNGDGKSTIVKRLINGERGVPGIPVVWGISATVERFDAAMKGMQGRSTLPNVVVDSAKVQASGLLKDTIILDSPGETGRVETVLVRRGTDKLKELSEHWTAYAEQQEDANTVLPLMVLQVPNTPDPNEIGSYLDTIFEQWPDLPTDSIAHVFGDHTAQTFGAYEVPYISPERVQESDWIRILIAKDAISTGWDCPRAEVMVSFRAAKDKTHITQLLGRMVRTPLARRIPGNERLNSVDCLLPLFDKKSVEEVAEALMTGGEAGEALLDRRVLINPREMLPNPLIPEAVWDKLLSLPSQSLPKKQSKPVKRLTALAHELAADGLMPDAGKTAHSEMHKVLDGAQVRYAEQISSTRQSVLTVEGTSLRTDLQAKEMSFDDFLEEADYAVIEDAYRRAARGISPDLARSYSEHLAEKEDGLEAEEALIEAHTSIAALGLLPEIKEHVEAEAEKLANQWLDKYRVEIKSLSDERQDAYKLIREMSTNPLDVTLSRPKMWIQPTTAKEQSGQEIDLPRYERHLMCDEEGLFPEDLNGWEKRILQAELDRDGTVGWYRNPSRASQDSLGITYEEGEDVKIVRPDFIFFTELPDGSIAADIVDPHGLHFSDALPKLKGLAQYAEANEGTFRRIEAAVFIDNECRILDLTEARVRQAVEEATSAKALYDSNVASNA
ncbi:MAG: DEAD/DEAH box helicase family protein [Rickettsiales bacterium]|nr:DEAD/DEAH box helicase family protein [Rickettsiales bacterium]